MKLHNLISQMCRAKAEGARVAVMCSLLACSVALACSKAAPEKSSPQPTPLASPVASAAARPTPAPASPMAGSPASSAAPDSDLPITWKIPAGWASGGPPGTMQKARYMAPPVAGEKEAAVVTVFYFGPGMGGTVEANIERWIGQFKNIDRKTVKQTERAMGGMTHHIVEIPEGNFESGMMSGMPSPGPQAGYGMLGAVVEGTSGKYFFKMVGPKHTVASHKPAFFELLESIQHKKP